jgi:hypothetical protein
MIISEELSHLNSLNKSLKKMKFISVYQLWANFWLKGSQGLYGF